MLGSIADAEDVRLATAYGIMFRRLAETCRRTRTARRLALLVQYAGSLLRHKVLFGTTFPSSERGTGPRAPQVQRRRVRP
jgi:hypothetical protein